MTDTVYLCIRRLKKCALNHWVANVSWSEFNMFMYIGFESTLVAKTPRANRHFTCSHVWYSEIVREYSTRVTKVDNAGSEEFVKTVL